MRRPRIPDDLSARVDAARGDVPFEAWVRRALEAALGDSSTAEQPRTREGNSQVAGSTPAHPAPPRAHPDFSGCDKVVNTRTGEELRVRPAREYVKPFKPIPKKS